jgi:hypothetical protein
MTDLFEVIRLSQGDARFKEVVATELSEKLRKKNFCDLFLIDDDFNRGIYRDYVRFLDEPNFKQGAFIFDNMVVSDRWGLVRCPCEGKIFNLTPGFGWMPNHFQHLIFKGHIEEFLPGRFEIKQESAKSVTLDGLTALLSFPGALTFGHWMVDLWGRVELLKRMGLFYQINQFLVPGPISEWMQPFFALFEIETSELLLLSRDQNYVCKKLVVPTVPSQSPGGVLKPSVFGRQFRTLSHFISQWFPSLSDGWSGPILLQHTPLTSDGGRVLGNATDVAELIKSRGGKVVAPTKISIGDLLQLIKQSSIVVGQDSSALHNVVQPEQSRSL